MYGECLKIANANDMVASVRCVFRIQRLVAILHGLLRTDWQLDMHDESLLPLFLHKPSSSFFYEVNFLALPFSYQKNGWKFRLMHKSYRTSSRSWKELEDLTYETVSERDENDHYRILWVLLFSPWDILEARVLVGLEYFLSRVPNPESKR